MSNHRIASRYAKSLLDLSREKGQVAEVFADVQLMDAAFESSRELRVFLKSPIVPTDKKLTVLTKIFGDKVSAITNQFITLMTTKGREGFLHDIANSFLEQYNTLKGITPVKISSAVKLEKSAVDALLGELKAKGSVNEVQLEEAIDPSLIGGYVLQYGDKQIDSSVRTSLQKLRNLVDDDSYVKRIR